MIRAVAVPAMDADSGAELKVPMLASRPNVPLDLSVGSVSPGVTDPTLITAGPSPAGPAAVLMESGNLGGRAVRAAEEVAIDLWSFDEPPNAVR